MNGEIIVNKKILFIALVLASSELGLWGILSYFSIQVWEYHYLPLLSGSTHVFTLVVWYLYALVGYFFYSHKNRIFYYIFFFGFLGPVLEIFLNGSFLLLFGEVFFSIYLPQGNIYHMTSIAIIPFYFGANTLMFQLFYFLKLPKLKNSQI